MPRELFCDHPESLNYRDYAPGKPTDTQVLVNAEFGAIKHGTEFFIFSGKSPFAGLRFDMDRRMFVSSTESGAPPTYRPGNMIVGTVADVGKAVPSVKPGDRVYTYAPLQEIAAADVRWVKPLDARMTANDAVCTDPAWFGFAAARDANVRVGDTAVVFGLGAIGLFAVQFLRLCGCSEIIAFDPIEKRRKLAEGFGATLTADPLLNDAAVVVHDHLRGKGVDAALEISGTYPALQSAMRCVAMCGRVVTVGFYKGNGTPLQLSMEWHHNRLQLISSMPDWENPSREYPLWDKQRMQETIVRLFREKKLSSEGIVDPVVKFDRAAEAYMEAYRNPASAIKLGVRFGS